MEKLHGLNVTQFLESSYRVDLGLWSWQSHRKSACWTTLPSAALRMCRLPVSQRAAILSATCCENVEAGQDRDGKGRPIKPKRERNSLRHSLSWEPNPQRWLSKARERSVCAQAARVQTHSHLLSFSGEREKGGKSISRAKYFHSEESPRGCSLLFLSAGANHKQWRPVL